MIKPVLLCKRCWLWLTIDCNWIQLIFATILQYRSCEDIVRLRTQDRIASGDDMAEKELNDLQGLKVGLA